MSEENIRVYDAEYLAQLIVGSVEDEKDLKKFLREIEAKCIEELNADARSI